MTYHGIYSKTIATTHVGAKLEIKDNKITGLTDTSPASNRHTFSSGSLADSDLNVAKIRLVSTIPSKKLPAEMSEKAYIGFILTDVQESHNEKVELVPLPGDSFASYFYGCNPRQFNFSGVLLNTDEDQWRDAFEQVYEKYLRGSVSSRNFNIVQVRYGGRIVSGWLTSLSQQLTSQSDLYAQFSFTVLVSRIDMIGGSNAFKDYLIDEKLAFKAADLSSDYAVLDPSNYNAMIDPLRTGVVVPPKRPKRGGRRSVNSGCGFVEPFTDAGQATGTGTGTLSDHILDSTNCTVLDAVAATDAKIKDITKKLEEIGRKASPTKADLADITKYQTQINDLQKNKTEKLATQVVIDQSEREATARLLQHINEERKTSEDPKLKNLRAKTLDDLSASEWERGFEQTSIIRNPGDTAASSISLGLDEEGNRVAEVAVRNDTNYHLGSKGGSDKKQSAAREGIAAATASRKAVEQRIKARKQQEENEKLQKKKDKTKETTLEKAE